MNHCMVDLETLGSSAGSVIVSIGAVAFHQGGDVSHFYVNVSINSCINAGLGVEAGSIKFWLTQTTEEARKSLFHPQPLGLREALHEFNTFWRDTNSKWLWAHGSDFDIPVLSLAYKAAGYDEFRPWSFRNDRDTRTLYSLLPKGFPTAVSAMLNTNKHHALCDAIYQAACVRAAYEELGKELPNE